MRTTTSSVTRKTAGSDDLTLLLTMADKDVNPAAADEALKEFFARHHLLLKAFAQKSKYQTLGFDVDDFVMQTFEKAYNKANQFEPGAEQDPEKVTRKVKAWLFGIMKSEFLMELRKAVNKKETLSEEEPESQPEAQDDAEESVPASQIAPTQAEQQDEDDNVREKAAVVRTFLESLPEKDRVLLETSMNFYDFKLKKAMIPKDILAGMAKALGTTPEGIKQKRKRLLESLREYVEKHT
jgi:RNA polymerase sigma factor (sigma-70 family)